MLSQEEFPWNFAVKDAIAELTGTKNYDLVTGVYIEPPERTSPEKTKNFASTEDEVPFFPMSDEYFERYAEIVFANHQHTSSRSSVIKLSLQKKEELVKRTSLFPEPNYTQYIGKTPTQIFELFFDEEIINLIYLATIFHAKKKQYDLSSLKREELKKFIAILLLSGYNKILRTPACYWEAPDVRNELVANSMHQERFIEIYEYINFELQAEMTKENENDRVWMLRPLITILQKRFVANLPPEETINFNEYMVDSFRRFDYMDMRHIPFGYKVSCLNTPSGYLIDFFVHNTKISNGIKYANEIGVAAAPLLLMLDRQPNKIRNLPYKIYFGDLKTNMAFLTELKQRGYTATGVFQFPEPEETGSLPIESCNGASILPIPEPDEKYPALLIESCNDHSENSANGETPVLCEPDITESPAKKRKPAKKKCPCLSIESCNDHSENTGNGEASVPAFENLCEPDKKESPAKKRKPANNKKYPVKKKCPGSAIESSDIHSESTANGTAPVAAFDEICVPIESESFSVSKPDEKYPSLPIGSFCDFSERRYITSVMEDGDYEIITWCTESGNPLLVSNSCAEKMPNIYEEAIIGTDTMKKHVELYRIGICNGRKWYWPLFTWLLDVTVHNAWLLMQKAGSNISQLDFRRAVVRAYLDAKVSAKPPFPARNASLLS